VSSDICPAVPKTVSLQISDSHVAMSAMGRKQTLA